MWKFSVAVAGSFQSTFSVRRATTGFSTSSYKIAISIHALRKESDQLFSLSQSYVCISIHALRQESDLTTPHTPRKPNISIHALRKESDTIHVEDFDTNR